MAICLKKNLCLILLKFESKFIINIKLPDEDELLQIPKTYITQTYELFILAETKTHFKMYSVNLDSYNNEKDKKNRKI